MPDVKQSIHKRSSTRSFEAYYGWDDFSEEVEFNWVNTRVSSRNPSWRKMVQAGVNATTNLDGYAMDVRLRPGTVRSLYGGDPSYWYLFKGTLLAESYHLPPNIPWHLLDGVNSQAVARFVQKCIDAQRAFQGSTFLGELKETLEMIKNPAKALRKGLRSYATLTTKKAKRLPHEAQKQRAISGSWLEWSFGAKPLMADIQAGVDALTKYVPNDTTRIRAGAKSKELDGDVFTGTTKAFYLDFARTREYHASVRYMGSVWCKPPYLGSCQFLSDYGFDPVRDFIPTAWELFPWSFFVDYFTNIGDILQSASFLTSNLQWWCRTYELRTQQVLKPIGGYRRASHTIVTNEPESSVSWQRTVKRDVPETLVPNFSWRIPGYGSTKWLNIAALANEARGKL